MIINARKEANLVNPSTGECMELDIYFPKLKFALKYQESIYHAFITSFFFLSLFFSSLLFFFLLTFYNFRHLDFVCTQRTRNQLAR